MKKYKLRSGRFVGLSDEATQKVRLHPKRISNLNIRLGVLQRIAKVKGCHTKGKMAFCYLVSVLRMNCRQDKRE